MSGYKTPEALQRDAVRRMSGTLTSKDRKHRMVRPEEEKSMELDSYGVNLGMQPMEFGWEARGLFHGGGRIFFSHVDHSSGRLRLSISTA